MTPQDTIYWVPVVVGLVIVFVIVLPFFGRQLVQARWPGWVALCAASGALLCIPIIQWFTLIAIFVMLYKVIFNKL